MEPIVLTNDDYNEIITKKKLVGSGVDGSIYKINKDKVYKFYHKEQKFINILDAEYDEDGVLINDFKSLRKYNMVTNNENIYYTDSDGVILTREEAIYKAMEKQKNVHLTILPQNIIYLNNKIAGCEYKYYPNRLGIYASAYLPLKKRLIICKRIIEKVKELLHNNIYPITMAQRDDMFPFKSKGSNILIGLDLEPQIIDLDGISAMYSDNFSLNNYNSTLSCLSSLVLEILSRVELADNIEDDEMVVDELIERMAQNNIPYISSKKYFDNRGLDLGELNYIIKTLEKRIK